VRVPNAERALIDRAKLTDYLLSPSHPIGRFKARFFNRLGFRADAWEELEHASVSSTCSLLTPRRAILRSSVSHS